MIADHATGGHRLAYIAALCKGFDSSTHIVVVLPERASETDEFRAHIEPCIREAASEVTVGEVGSCLRLRSSGRERRRWVRGIFDSATAADVDTLIFPMADWIAGAVAVRWFSRRGRPKSLRLAVMPYTYAAYVARARRRPALDRFRRAASLLALRLDPAVQIASVCRQAHLPAPASHLAAVRSAGRLLNHAPNLVEVRLTAQGLERVHQQILNQAGDRAICLTIGDLGRRKALDRLLSLWNQEATSALSDLLWVLVGRLSPADEDLAASSVWADLVASGRMVHLNAYVDSEFFDAAIARAAVVLAGFDGASAPSDVVGKSLALGVPVVSFGNPLLTSIADQNLRYVSEPTPQAVATAVAAAAAVRRASLQPPMFVSNSDSFHRAVLGEAALRPPSA